MRFSELDGKRVGVWGVGREIRSFATQLAKHAPRARIVTIVLDAPADGPARELAGAHGASLVGAAQAHRALAESDLVVRSPSVSIHRPELVALRESGVALTTATALWMGDRDGRGVIGVTGTKGKSTTAALIAHLARGAGGEIHLAGNIGAPALDLLDAPATELAVVELSSYQIADLQAGPEIAVVTNLYREHTDWHGSYETYRVEKLRLLGLPGVRASILNGRDPELAVAAERAPAPVLYGRPEGWNVRDGAILYAGEAVVEIDALPLRGEHNALNLCAALSALEAHGVARPALPEALLDFVGLPHRLQTVSTDDGVVWVDDSISTTPESTLAALASFGGDRIVLLAGGEDRGQDYELLGRELAAREAIVIGLPNTGAGVIERARAAGVPASHALAAGDMADAVRLARSLAHEGSVVLLSPAAPSYNAYRNFEERGAHFRESISRS